MNRQVAPYDSPEADCIEPEIVSHGPERFDRNENAQRYKGPTADVNPFYAFFQKIKFIFAAAVVLVSFGLIILGAILTSTIIGAVIGIPLVLVGVFLLWFLFKVLTLGSKPGTFIFKRF